MTAKDMLEKSEQAKKFLYRYDMQKVDGNRRQQKYVMPKFSILDKYDFDQISQPMYYETETLFTIQIPESRLESLVDFHNRVEESIKYTGSMDMFNHMLQKQREEKEFREKHPAVQKAYEQYQLMYKLASSGEN